MAKSIIPNATKLITNYITAVCEAGKDQALQLLAAALMVEGWEFSDTHNSKVVIKAAHEHFGDAGCPGFITLSKRIGADLEGIDESKIRVAKVAFSRFCAANDLGLVSRKGAGGRKATKKANPMPTASTVISALKGGVFTAKEIEAIEAAILSGKAKARKTA